MTTRKTVVRTQPIHLAVAFVLLFVGTADAAPIVTAPVLDTANDLMDIGGGTLFNGNIDGGGGSFGYLDGGFPWTTFHGANLFDNDTSTTTVTQWNNTPNPAIAGTYGMTEAVQLGGFAVTTGPTGHNGFQITIQGSNDSTNGWGGNWTDIFVYNGDLTGNQTYRWNASDNTFLTNDTFAAFRLAEYTEYKRYAEIEFFALPLPQITGDPANGSILDLGSVLEDGAPITCCLLEVENTGDAGTTLSLAGFSTMVDFGLDSGNPAAALISDGVVGSGSDIESFLFSFDPASKLPGVYTEYITLGSDAGDLNYTLRAEVLAAGPIPEPSTLLVWSSLGLLGLALARRRRR